MLLDPAYLDAIAAIESGGKFDALGPVLKSGDRAYGRYQVMGANIGPWTKEILGFEMTPQQFFDSPEAQDAVFQGKFGQYVQKYGPEGAAQAWFGGPGAVGKEGRKDILGTSVGDYGRKFMLALGQQPSPLTSQVGPTFPGMPGGYGSIGGVRFPVAGPISAQQKNHPTQVAVLAQNGPPIGVSANPMLGYGQPPNNVPAASPEAQPKPTDPDLDHDMVEIAQILPPNMLGGAYRRPADFRKLTALIRSIR